jgi:hypothetical protein
MDYYDDTRSDNDSSESPSLHPKDDDKPLVLITGHPRCGTGTMTKVFEMIGVPIGHEKMGPCGTSNWVYAFDTNTICFSRVSQPRSRFHFSLFIHCVRDPFYAIPSIALTETTKDTRKTKHNAGKYQSTAYRTKMLGLTLELPIEEHAAQSFLRWNQHVAKNRDFVVRVEYALQDLAKNFSSLEPYGVNPLCEWPRRSNIPILNRRPHKKFTKSNWSCITPRTLDQLEVFCRQYHYPSIKKRIA